MADRDPLDFSDRYNTALTPEQESAYQAWKKQEGREGDEYDYDLRGAWVELQQGTMKEDERRHLGDRYKKPNHPTFSDQSIYHGQDGYMGGHWSGDDKSGLTYTAAPSNMWRREDLERYFGEREPGVTLRFDEDRQAEAERYSRLRMERELRGADDVRDQIALWRDQVRKREMEARERLAAALRCADGTTAEEQAKAGEYARKLNLPRETVAAAMDYASEQVAYQELSRDEKLAAWAAESPRNAAFARDDRGPLEDVFKFFDIVGDASEFITRELPFKAGRSFMHGVADVNTSMANAVLALAENTLGADSVVSRWIKRRADWFDWARPDEVKADSRIGELGWAFFRSAPQMLFSLLGAATGNIPAAVALTSTQVAGGTYGELRKEGVSPARALVSGAMNAAMQAPLERIGLDRMAKVFGSQSTRDVLIRGLGSMATEGVTEFAQKFPEVLATIYGQAEKRFTSEDDRLAWTLRTFFDASTLAQAAEEGLLEGIVGAMWGGVGAAGRISLNWESRQRAQEVADQLIAFQKLVDKTKTKALAPDVLEDALDHASPVLAQSVYIPAQAALDLADKGQDVLTPLGITREEAQAAAEQGVDLETKLSALHARLDTDGLHAVSQIMRETPDAPSLMDLLSTEGSEQSEINAVAEYANARKRRLDDMRKEEARLIREISPLASKEVARQQARIITANARAFEYAYGVNPVEMVRRVHVERGEEANTESGTLNQQSTAPIVVRGSELGVPEGADIQQYIAAAKKYHDAIKYESEHGQPVMQPQLDRPVRFSGKGWKKNIHTGANPTKWKMFPHLREIIETSTLKQSVGVNKVRADDFTRFHWVENTVEVDGTLYRVGLTLAEDSKGNLFYNLNADLDVWQEKSGSSTLPTKSRAGVSEPLQQSANAPVENTVPSSDDGVNLSILSEGPATAASPAVRGNVELGTQRITIRIFKGADLSTITHESAHIFVDNLLRVARDDGSIARARLRENLLAAGVSEDEINIRLRTTQNADDARTALRDVRRLIQETTEGITKMRQAIRDLTREQNRLRKAGDETGADAVREEMNLLSQQLDAFTADEKRLPKVEQALVTCVRHMDGLAQAKADIATLREFAGKPAEGDLSPEEWRDVQEYAARGFEQYMSEGKAPTPELEGVFARMLKWLKNLYASWRDYVGKDLTPEVRMVFDRLLVSEVQAKANALVTTTLGNEQGALEEMDLTADERSELDGLAHQSRSGSHEEDGRPQRQGTRRAIPRSAGGGEADD